MKRIAKICLVLLTAMTMAAVTANAQTNSMETCTNTPPAAAKPKPKRYIGKIDSVDAAAKTITFTTASGVTQTIHITSKTRIRKDGQPATFDDATVGEKIRGTERELTPGEWTASTVSIGEPKPKPAPAAATTNAPADK